MPTEDTACKLAELVKTTENKVFLINQAHSLLNDLSKVVPPSAQDIQNTYPFLSKILLECSPDLEQLLSNLDSLDEITFTTSRALEVNTLTHELSRWTAENTKVGLLVTCISSSEILGGVLISQAGRFLNLSLDKIIKEKVYA